MPQSKISMKVFITYFVASFCDAKTFEKYRVNLGTSYLYVIAMVSWDVA